MDDQWRPPCSWCGLMSELEVEIEPAHIGTHKGERVVIRPARTRPICGLCHAQLGRGSLALNAEIVRARARLWARRQERLC